MPETLKNFEQHQTKYIENHPNNLSEKEEKIILEFLSTIIKENDLGMCVPMKYFKEILETNKLKNQLELNHGTTINPQARIAATQELFGTKENLDYKEYPKYGFILDKNPLRHMLQDTDLFYHYGNIILILKKENLINRTTMTLGSSLNFKAYEKKCPMLLTKSNICCIEENLRKKFYDLIINNEINTTTPGKINEVLGSINPTIDTYELQFHGEITFSEDVEKVCLLPMNMNDEKEFEENFLPTLNKMNIPYKLLTFEI